MVRLAASVLVLLSLAAPAVDAEPTTHIRASIAHVKFDREPSSRSTVQLRHPAASGRGRNKGMVVAGLATVGAFGGMFIASRVALPCGCDDPESVVARGGMIGAAVGAIAGIVLTSR